MSIEQLMEQHTTYLLKLAYLYVKDRQIAEDVVQEVFVTYYRKQNKLLK